uniref:Uncharacterized protein n=1 Tax=Tanacetum cinerariifolium TaxID=118510 RepID=A0A6L2NAP4_TANCI|nr:hypothetical protein [Tanacetum cinerariifolium]
MGNRIVEDVVVETAKVDVEVGNEVVDDDKMGNDIKVKTSNSVDLEFLVMEVDKFVTDRNRRWEDEDKYLNVFDYDCEVYYLSKKALLGAKEFFVNKKQEEDFDKIKRDIKHETVKELVDESNGLVEAKIREPVRYEVRKGIKENEFFLEKVPDQCTLISLNLVTRHGTCALTKKRIRDLDVLSTRVKELVKNAKETRSKWSSPLSMEIRGGEVTKFGLIKEKAFEILESEFVMELMLITNMCDKSFENSCQSMVEEEEPEADIKVPEQVDTKVPGPVLEMVDNELVPEIVSKLIDTKADIEDKLGSQSHMTSFSGLGFSDSHFSDFSFSDLSFSDLSESHTEVGMQLAGNKTISGNSSGLGYLKFVRGKLSCFIHMILEDKNLLKGKALIWINWNSQYKSNRKVKAAQIAITAFLAKSNYHFPCINIPFTLAIILNRLRKIHSKGLASGDDNNDGDHPETSNTSPPVPPQTQQIPHTISSVKLPILKKGEYDIWAMKMEHYLSHTDYPIWQKLWLEKGREKQAPLLLMALPEDHLAKLHKMTDAKEIWEAIKSRIGGNDESKKMQKYLLKQKFEGFSVSTSEGLHKGYDRFQTLLSRLEIHGVGVSHEDANQKFLRSLHSSWSQVALIMRTKEMRELFTPYSSKPITMSTLTFAKTYNLIAYLAKPTESKGFEQIIDFLNGISVSYALTASPIIRTSCIKQFWTTAKVKTINDEVRIQALIDEKRINIKESFIFRTLKLDDAEGTSCLANAEIFDEVQLLKVHTTYLVKNIKAGVHFFMFPRFVQLQIDHHLGDVSHHNDIYDNPSFIKKVFANMKRVGIGFSEVVTPLFENMLVSAAKEVGLIQDDVQSITIPTEPSTSKPHKKHKSKKQQTQAPKVSSPEPSPKHRLHLPSNDPLPGDEDSLKLKELMDLRAHLSNKVLEFESEVIDIKSTYKERIVKLECRVDRLEEENKVLKELHSVHSKVNIAAPVVEKEKSFKRGRIIADIDEDVEINLEEAQGKLYRIDLEHSEKVLSMHDVDNEEPADVEEVLEVVKAAKLMTEVVTTARATNSAEATKHYGISNHLSCYKSEVQLFKLGDVSHHKDIYDNPSLTKKVFANMKRVGTGFYGVVTPLFENMLVPATKEVGLIQDDVQSITIPTEPSTSKPYKKYKSKKQQTQAPKVPFPKPSPKHRLHSSSNDPLPGGEDSLKLKELIDLCTHLSNKVLELESEVIDIKSTYKERIEKLECKVDRLEEENKVLKELHSVHSKVDTVAPVVEKEKSFKQGRIIADIDEDDVDDEELADVEEVMEVVKAAKLMTEVVTTSGATTTVEATKVSVPRRRRGVVIQDPEETTSIVVVHSEVQSKDKGKGILIEEPKSLKGQAQIEQDEAFARQLEAELNADINWNVVMEQVKRNERLNDAVMKYQALKRKPLTEAQGRKNMIIYLKNMAGYTMNYFKGMTYSEIKPLFEKHYNYNQAFLEEVNEEVTVSEKEVEVEGHKREGGSLEKEITKKQKMDEESEELKSHLQIVSNDDNDNFDREDLESLWKLVKERFKKTEPKKYTDDYLLKTLKTMSEQPDVEASRYPLTHFNLEQMLNNVRLKVEKVSEMSLELLRLVRRQLNEREFVIKVNLRLTNQTEDKLGPFEVLFSLSNSQEEKAVMVNNMSKRHQRKSSIFGWIPTSDDCSNLCMKGCNLIRQFCV